jgi:uncharacterized protein (DUF1330 family)
MAAYVLSEVRSRDPELLARYRELAAASIARHGGRYLVRGREPVPLEGDWADPDRLVLVEFPDRAAAEAWYRSADYAEALAVRAGALDRRLLLVDGG